MKICWFGIFSEEYPRNYVFFEGLKELGIEIIKCNVSANERFWRFKLIKKFWSLDDDFDVLYVGFPSQPALLIAKLLTRKKVVMDAMSSMYEGMVDVRELKHKFHPAAIRLLISDWVTAFLADQLIVDTIQHKLYWSSWLFIDHKKIDVVPLGASTKHFFPISEYQTKNNNKLLVQYHGSYIKVQGLDVIVKVIELLKGDDSIEFRFIGAGEEYKKIKASIEETGNKNVNFLGPQNFTELNLYLNEADVVLGLFGSAKRADRAVANKVYEGLAVSKVVINKDTPAIHEELTPDSIVLVKREPEEIAKAIKGLKNRKFREEVAANGHTIFLKNFTELEVAKKLLNVLNM